jgi:hypothetical protein
MRNPSGGQTIGFDRLWENIITQIANPIIYLLFALAVVYFMWGVMVFIKNADSPEKRAEGFQHMKWGIIGVFIMISAKGIINLILATLGLR